ncbi:MAG: hypothetical protein ACYDCN_12505 [Bacteroidia bacterium]
MTKQSVKNLTLPSLSKGEGNPKRGTLKAPLSFGEGLGVRSKPSQ